MTSVNELLMSHVVVRGVDTSVPPHKRVQAAWREWEALGDLYVARIARNGLQFEWIPGFDPLHPDDIYRPFSLSPYARDDLDDDEVLQREIDKLILAGHVSEIEPEDAKCVTSIFLVEKKPHPKNPQGSSRPCTNLKPLNRFRHVTYFSLPMLREILPYLKKGYYACKLDLKSAYLHMPIAKRDAPWLAFRHRGRVFRWDCLPFGLNIAPREWQRMMLPVVSHLRRKGVLLWVYLDDFLIIAPTVEDCALHTQWLADLLCRLGVQIHIAKSVLTPTRVLVFLGFLLDLQDATVRIPPHKLKSLLHDVRQLMEAETPTCRRCLSVLGRLRALLFAAPQMRLYTDALAQHVAVLSRREWETQASLPEQVTIQLELAMEELHQWRGRQFTVDLEKTHMWTDASDYGWGATMQNQMATFGWFRTTQRHLDLREFRAGVNAIKAYLLRDTELHLHVDNVVFFHYLKEWGGRIRRLNNLMQELWEYCRQMNVFPTSFHTTCPAN